MGSGEEASPRELRLVHTHPAGVSRELVVQKESWDANAYFAWANQDSGIDCFGVELYDGEEEKPAAVMIAVSNRVYGGLVLDSMIIDRAHRSIQNLTRYGRAFHAYLSAFAPIVGAKYIACSTPRPRAMKRILGDDSIREVETILRREV